LLTALGCTNRTPLEPPDDADAVDGGGPTAMRADAAPADADAAPADAGMDATAGDAVGPDADAGGPCAVTTAAGATLPCTERIVAFSLADAYCGLKAGQVRCWTNDPFFDNLLAPIAAQAPPGLVQLAAAETVNDDPAFCGLDAQGNGTCWGAHTMTNMGDGLASVVLSRYGTCALHRDGHVACTGAFPLLPSNHHYAQIAVAADFLIGLDDTGTPVNPAPYPQIPPGVYTRVAELGGTGAAVRDDGALIYLTSPDPVVHAGTFADLMFQSLDHLCGLDRAGRVTCFPIGTGGSAPLVPPLDRFDQVAAGSRTMCGLHRTGTTTCWGNVPLAVPDGW